MKPGSRTHGPASLKLGYCQIAPPNLRGGLLEISRFTTPKQDRGKGHGTALLQAVCDEADEASKSLILLADSASLAMYYERFGFERMQDDPIIMLRAPAMIAARHLL